MSRDGPERELDALGHRLDRARGEAQAQGPRAPTKLGPGGSAAALAFRVGVELVSALAVGVAIGWLLDSWLGTGPWLLLVFILLGGAAGIVNVYRVTRNYGYAAGYAKNQESGDGNPDTGDQGSEDRDVGPGS